MQIVCFSFISALFHFQHSESLELKVIPSRGREVRGLLRTRDGQTTGWRDGESLLNLITTGRQKDRKTRKTEKREWQTVNRDYYYIFIVSTENGLKMFRTKWTGYKKRSEYSLLDSWRRWQGVCKACVCSVCRQYLCERVQSVLGRVCVLAVHPWSPYTGLNADTHMQRDVSHTHTHPHTSFHNLCTHHTI